MHSQPVKSMNNMPSAVTTSPTPIHVKPARGLCSKTGKAAKKIIIPTIKHISPAMPKPKINPKTAPKIPKRMPNKLPRSPIQTGLNKIIPIIARITRSGLCFCTGTGGC